MTDEELRERAMAVTVQRDEAMRQAETLREKVRRLLGSLDDIEKVTLAATRRASSLEQLLRETHELTIRCADPDCVPDAPLCLHHRVSAALKGK